RPPGVQHLLHSLFVIFRTVRHLSLLSVRGCAHRLWLNCFVLVRHDLILDSPPLARPLRARTRRRELRNHPPPTESSRPEPHFNTSYRDTQGLNRDRKAYSCFVVGRKPR